MQDTPAAAENASPNSFLPVSGENAFTEQAAMTVALSSNWFRSEPWSKNAQINMGIKVEISAKNGKTQIDSRKHV